jgi:hypothetical protein
VTEQTNAPASLPQAPSRDLLEHVQGLLGAKPPGGDFLVPGSTPVVAFGDILQARVATLGINPSVAEFSRDGVPITPRRLATVGSLGLVEGEAPNLEHARELLHDCRTYYARNPYWRWFLPLERLLTAATGYSYTSGTACHLDLVPWATDPVWGGIPSRQAREELLSAGLPYLQYLLRHLDLRLLLMNGAQVVNQVAATRLGELEHVDTIPYDDRGSTTKLYVGEGNGVLFLGWSVNVQGTPGRAPSGSASVWRTGSAEREPIGSRHRRRKKAARRQSRRASRCLSTTCWRTCEGGWRRRTRRRSRRSRTLAVGQCCGQRSAQPRSLSTPILSAPQLRNLSTRWRNEPCGGGWSPTAVEKSIKLFFGSTAHPPPDGIAIRLTRCRSNWTSDPSRDDPRLSVGDLRATSSSAAERVCVWQHERHRSGSWLGPSWTREAA